MAKHYVFSDIHGNYNLFKQIKDFLKPNDVCYVLGDCADRGKDGYKIIKEVLNDDRFIYIKGNHEDMFVKALLEHKFNFERVWFYNGGQPTFDAYAEDEEKSKKLLLSLDWLPETAEYTNAFGVTFIMSHAGFKYTANEKNRDYLWDRRHYLYEDKDIPDNVVLIHGHTPIAHVSEATDGIIIDGDNCKEGDGVYLYNNGRKICIDCCTFVTDFIALYCLDDGEVLGFYDE